jgi:hypothetical protein
MPCDVADLDCFDADGSTSLNDQGTHADSGSNGGVEFMYIAGAVMSVVFGVIALYLIRVHRAKAALVALEAQVERERVRDKLQARARTFESWLTRAIGVVNPNGSVCVAVVEDYASEEGACGGDIESGTTKTTRALALELEPSD